MKDNQIAAASTEPRIFLLSPVLHCVSMTALVFLRSSFGYGFLRPKSVFFAFSWAFLLFAVYAWIDRDAWQERRALLWFGSGAVVLYWLHLVVAVRREWRGSGRHDNDAGTPHAIRALHLCGVVTSPRFDATCRVLAEPALIGSVALLLYFLRGEKHLAAWLLFAAVCLWAKEILNRWFSIRRRKRGTDLTEDAADTFNVEPANHIALKQPPLASARKGKIVRPRTRAKGTSEHGDENRF